MKKILLVPFVLLSTALAFAQSMPDLSSLSSSDSLSGLADKLPVDAADFLQNELDMTEDQAEGSLGSLLSLASENLNSGQFDQLASLIPGANKYLDAAKSLGAVSEPLKSLGDLNNALASLGVSPEMIQQFIPMISDYVGKIGGADAAALLQQALGG